ncbi:FG-GAP-like repeat-containing protein [Pendulispora brunnea]|uniref:FG-GAP-like repeat-containing protein n=1 Tax=Pendulispora brunnea TaxID=2905690 RepID=A0ABZ2KN89_9BACT
MRTIWQILAAAVVASFASTSSAQTTPFTDARVQAPELRAPTRGSLAGQYASLAFGPGDVSRGLFSLPLPVAVPGERGALAAAVIPTYSAEHGLSEWGVGWSVPALVIQRTRVLGDIDYRNDELTGPWGRMILGDDAAWYPLGMKTPVRVVPSGEELVAYLPDGSRWTFGGAVRNTTAAGTYGWYLTDITTATGSNTTFTYEKNTSGRPFLTTVTYGGTKLAPKQYQLTFDYSPLSVSPVDYRSGEPKTLDRRVTAVHARVAQGGAYAERYRYEIAYTEESRGLAFFLTSLQQVFPNGRMPATTYTYTLGSDYFKEAREQRAAGLDTVLAKNGSDSFQPNRSSSFDADLDGRPDLELAFDQRMLRQTNEGWVAEALPPPSSSANSQCRPAAAPSNSPRMVARLRGDSDQLNVLGLIASPSATALFVCERDGTLLSQMQVPGKWEPGPTTRLVDLNHDHQPDFVLVQTGGYKILPNQSTASGVAFGNAITGLLSPSFTPSVAWVYDFNGDGIPDLIAATQTSLVVWFGKGNFAFETKGKSFPVVNTLGQSIGDMSPYQVSFLDANNDGLSDLLLTGGTSPMLFTNSGTMFRQLDMPAFRSSHLPGVRPVVLDLGGTGNTGLAYAKDGLGYAFDLDGPGVGLMSSANDGRGTVVQFAYDRAPPEAGVRLRNSVLARVQVTTTGVDPVVYDYTYGQPTLHSVGKFLVGYGQVQRRSPLDATTESFLNGNDWAGLLVQRTERDDLSSAVERFAFKEYEDARTHGVAWKRVKREGKGWRSTDPSRTDAFFEQTQYLAYERDVCASRTRTITRAGELSTTKTFYDLQAFNESLSCLDKHIIAAGTHADASLDFRHEAELARTHDGLLEGLTLYDANGTALVDQSVIYDIDGLPTSITTPATGTTTYGYDPTTRLLASITGADGVATAVTRDPITDSIISIGVNRGRGAYVRSFEFDAFERLSASWDNLGRSSQQLPLETYSYRYANGNLPALVQGTTLVDAARGIYARTAEAMTGGGETLAQLHAAPEGWVFDSLSLRERSVRRLTSLTRATANFDVAGLDVPGLYASAQQVGVAQQGLFDLPVVQSQKLHADVERDVTTTLGLSDGLTRTDVENAATSTVTSFDERMHTVGYRDEAGARMTYDYDAFGRVRRVHLADGAEHRIDYDAYGHPIRIDRGGVGAIAYFYDARTGLLRERDFSPPGGGLDSVVRKVLYQYDGIGRLVNETHVDVPSGDTQVFRYYHDGASPSSPDTRNARGLLSAVTSEGYTKTLEYRLDGLESHRSTTIAGWRQADVDVTYDDRGRPRGRLIRLRDGRGNLLATNDESFSYDAYGRQAKLDIDGNEFAAYGFDTNDHVASASFSGSYAHGERVNFTYDPLTRTRTGVQTTTAGWTSSLTTRMNARALIGSQDIKVGGTSLRRAFGYSPQRFLASSTDATDAYSYAYDPTGLPTRIQHDAHGTSDVRTLERRGSVLSAGHHFHTFDSLGRVVQRDEVILTYGPNGQVSSASTSTKAWSYLYDETGARIAKLVGGQAVAAYLEGGTFVDATSMTEPVVVDGQTVGVLRVTTPAGGAGTKELKVLATDLLGTILSDTNGTARLPSPFGERDVHPDESEAIDYAAKAWDPDLGVVRMGVRDYDPLLARFLTADPLFLEHPEKCIESPSECNLYGYARNLPSQLKDPTGTFAGVDDGAEAAAGVIFFTALTLHFYLQQPAVQRDLRAAASQAADRLKELVSSVTSSSTKPATQDQTDSPPVLLAKPADKADSGDKAVAKEDAKDKRQDKYVVRLQAQGGHLEKSVVFSQSSPVTAAQALAGLEALRGELTKSQRKERAVAFVAAEAWIVKTAAGGGSPPDRKSFYIPGVRGTDARVDIEILAGHNIVK